MRPEVGLDLINWWAAVRPEFALLVALPFLVGAAALLADWVRTGLRHPGPGELPPRASRRSKS